MTHQGLRLLFQDKSYSPVAGPHPLVATAMQNSQLGRWEVICSHGTELLPPNPQIQPISRSRL